MRMNSATIKVKSPAKILNKAGKERRSVGKVLNLAATYGMSGKTAGIRLGYEGDEAREKGEELLNNFFTGFSGVKKAIDDSKEFLKKNGYVEDFIGRRRHLPDINLPAYTAEMKDSKNGTDANFNPILGCANRTDLNAPNKIWEEIVKRYAKYVNDFQASKAKKEGKEVKPSDEIGNKTYEHLQKIALNPKSEKNKPWNEKSKLTAAQKIKQVTGLDIPDEPVILHANTGRRAQAERQCFNARIQGSAASLTKLAMIDIYNDPRLREYDTHLIIPVHDELLVECPAYYADKVEKILPEIMVNAAKKGGDDVPQACDPYNVYRWYGDEICATLIDEFKKLEAGDPKKGVAPKSKEEALEVLYKNHCEFPPESILKVITGEENELIFD